MALNFLSIPETLTPAYNSIEFTFSGTNYTKVGYRYVVDVYNTNTNTKISRLQIAPQLDGSGKIDISRIISNYVDVDFTGNTSTLANASNTYFNYYVSLGETYKADNWSFSSATNNGGFVKLNGLSAHTFIVDDQLIISSNSDFSGFYKVKSFSGNTVTINKSYVLGGIGEANYADGRKIIVSGVSTSSGYTAFNGAKSFDDFITYSGNDYTLSLTSTTKQLLTNLPSNFYATKTQDILLNAYINKTGGYEYFMLAIDNLGNPTSAISSVNGTNKAVSQFNIGYDIFYNPEPVIPITYYDVYLFRSIGFTFEQMSKPYRVYVDNRCKINDYEVAFMDRMGSIGSFAFQLRSNESGNITRTQYKAQVPSSYTTEDRGTKNIFIGVEKEFTFNTNWMTDEMSVYFEELLTSPYQWVKLDDGQYHACVVTETAFEIERQKNKNLIRKTVTIKLANNSSINI